MIDRKMIPLHLSSVLGLLKPSKNIDNFTFSHMDMFRMASRLYIREADLQPLSGSHLI